MSTVDTVNHVREINTNLEPIYISTDAGKWFELPSLTYRERLALTTKLLRVMTTHPHTARHQVPSADSVIRQMTFDSEANLQAEKEEDERIERELKQEAERQGSGASRYR
ncbi:MAG: hypothetical protein ACYDDS_19775 [Candidatus Sulfotelmatobacter sp.]